MTHSSAGVHRRWTLALLVACVAWPSQAFVIGSYNSAKSSRPFLGADFDNLRANLSNPANFGPGGTVTQAVSYAPAVGSINAATLAGYDLFVLTEPFGMAAQERTDLTNWVYGGGCLVIQTDSGLPLGNNADLVLNALDGGHINGFNGNSGGGVGLIVASTNSSNGPFGNLLGATFGASPGSPITPGSKTTIVGRTQSNTVNLLGEIPLGALGAGAGGVLIATDVLFMDFFVPPGTLYPNSNNGLLFMNFVAAQANGTPHPDGTIPEPGSMALLGLGCVAFWRRRRQ